MAVLIYSVYTCIFRIYLYIPYTVFMVALILYFVHYDHGYMKSFPLKLLCQNNKLVDDKILPTPVPGSPNTPTEDINKISDIF